jgi:hypothetical protein
MKDKQANIKTMETQLKTMKDEYDKQSLILSEAARKQKEQEFMNAQMQYQQAAQQSEQEMQQMYVQLMEGLLAKMRAIAGEIGKEKGYDLILETSAGGVVYWGATLDITPDLILGTTRRTRPRPPGSSRWRRPSPSREWRRHWAVASREKRVSPFTACARSRTLDPST